jgi:hypothetical protein
MADTEKCTLKKRFLLYHYPFRITGDGKTYSKFSIKSIVFKISLVDMRTEVENDSVPVYF